MWPNWIILCVYPCRPDLLLLDGEWLWLHVKAHELRFVFQEYNINHNWMFAYLANRAKSRHNYWSGIYNTIIALLMRLIDARLTYWQNVIWDSRIIADYALCRRLMYQQVAYIIVIFLQTVCLQSMICALVLVISLQCIYKACNVLPR